VEVFELPGREESERLLLGLSNLIRLRGMETFVAAPLVLPEPRFFPEPVSPRAEGVATLLRRLLAFAGLEPERIDLEIYPDRHDGMVMAGSDDAHTEAAAWFMDISQGVYRFGVRESELNDTEGLIGTLGHEVAHAYRFHHQLVVRDRDREEQLTDLTTIYLGFGVFTLTSSFQFKTGHYGKTGERLLYERQTRGYLMPGQLAFLLAAQLVARRAREGALLKTVVAALSENHAAAVREAVSELSAEEPELYHTLGLPAHDAWPPLHSLDELLQPLPPAQVRLLDKAKVHRERYEAGKIGFRVRSTRRTLGTALGFAMGFSVAALMQLQLAFWPLTLGAGALGWLVGRNILAPKCSGCGHHVALEAERCAFCSLRLVGDVHENVDRLTAEEEYRERALLVAKQEAMTEGRLNQACPACDWRPRPSDEWQCECGRRWNTFRTAGKCPKCEKQWQTTQCLRCREVSEHDAWYGSAG
jgi:hypothetical protein